MVKKTVEQELKEANRKAKELAKKEQEKDLKEARKGKVNKHDRRFRDNDGDEVYW
jgi:hypothetical protein